MVWLSYCVNSLLRSLNTAVNVRLIHVGFGIDPPSLILQFVGMGAYLGEIAPMASVEMTPTFCITITSAKKIMIMQLIVAKY